MADACFADKKFIEIKGRWIACIDKGEGTPIVFQHAECRFEGDNDPTSNGMHHASLR